MDNTPAVDVLANSFIKPGSPAASLPATRRGKRPLQYGCLQLAHRLFRAKSTVFYIVSTFVFILAAGAWSARGFGHHCTLHPGHCQSLILEVPGPLELIKSWVDLTPSLLAAAVAGVSHQKGPISSPGIVTTSTTMAAVGTGASPYTGWTVSAIESLQTWYDKQQGLWRSTNWWNSANCLTVLGDFSSLDAGEAQELDLIGVFANTFTQAQTSGASRVRKVLKTTGSGQQIVQTYPEQPPVPGVVAGGSVGFLNDYYDDEGWWALAWIRAYDVTGTPAYLSMAESIFADMEGGASAECGGGIWWSKEKTYKNAIANELYLSVAASLANRASSSNRYLAIAEDQWNWFQNSSMINSDNLINDGLNIDSNGTCVNNGGETWTYNQGVILGGLAELYKANGNASLLGQAGIIAEAAIDALSVGEILRESCEVDGEGCDGDKTQFKGASSNPSAGCTIPSRRWLILVNTQAFSCAICTTCSERLTETTSAPLC